MKSKHLTLDQRKAIQDGIENRLSKTAIARLIGKDPSTVAKEITAHRKLKPRNRFILPSSAPTSNHAPSLASFAPTNALSTKNSPAHFVTAPSVPAITANASKGADWITSSTMLQGLTKSISSICPIQGKV